MSQGNWIPRTTQCAVAWREPRWKPLLLGAPRAWVHAAFPRGLSAAFTAPPVIARAAIAPGPGGHGS
jgi:hypothetical protein